MSQLRRNSKFGIGRAAMNGWRFTARNGMFLFKAGLIPLAFHLAGNLFVFYVHPDAGMVEAFLWTMPASIFLAWYSFIIVRRIVLDETPDNLPTDATFRQGRNYCQRVSIILSLLFNMGLAAMGSALSMIVQSGKLEEGNAAITLVAIVAMLLTLWSFRFGALALAAAVDYPLASFLRQVAGFEFSLRLLGLGMLVALPLVFLVELIASNFIENPLDPNQQDLLLMVIIGSPLALSLSILLTAATTFALKEMLGNSENTGTT